MKIRLTEYFSVIKRFTLMLMRLFVFLFCTTVLSFPSKGLSQNAIITIEESQTVSVDEVFKMIKSQTNYSFVYQEEMFKGFPMVSLDKGTIRVNDLLEKAFSSGKVIFKFLDKTTIAIGLKKKGTVQGITITGRVTDKNGIPIPGMNVIVTNSEPKDQAEVAAYFVRGTTTDFDGFYTLNADVGNYLAIYGLGYQLSTQQIVFEQQEYNVALKELMTELDEVTVVSTGYQKISKERATGAVGSVAKSQLEKPASSISERLVGMVAGVQSNINADGSVDFEIRGQSSLFGDAEPLIVYDGFPIEGGFETINPNDVESITILKDAAAASIWGAKSANGVIVITSKKAKEGKVNVSFSSFLRVSPKIDLDYAIGAASSAEIIEYERRGFETNFFGGSFTPPAANVFNVSRAFTFPPSLGITALNEARLGRISEAERDATLARLAGLNNRQQISDHLLQAPITRQYNLGINGGTETINNRLSLIFEDNQGFFQGNDRNKYQVDFASNVKLAKGINFDIAGMFQYNDIARNGTDLEFLRTLSPYDMLLNEDGSLTDLSYLQYYKPNLDAFVPTELFPNPDWSFNPISDLSQRDFSTRNLNYRLQTGLTVDLLKGLTLTSRIQYELFETDVENYTREGAFIARRFVNETAGWNFSPTSAPVQNIPNGGILQQSETSVSAYNFRNLINYDRTFSEKHNITVFAGTEISNRLVKQAVAPDVFGYNGETLATGNLLNPVDGARMWNGFPLIFSSFFFPYNIEPNQFVFTESTSRFFSLFGNLAYTYDSKYTLSGSYRTDASNIISDDPKFRYNPFWSVGGSWNAHNEPFLQGNKTIDRLVLRATYGVNGNIDRSTAFRPLISLGTVPDRLTDELDAEIADFGNPTLRWEKTRTSNFGLDFSLWNRKLYGSVEVYNKRSFDLIVDQAIPTVNGTPFQRLNNGKMENNGVELTLGTTMPIKGNDVVWSGSVNFAHNRNRITEFFKPNYIVEDFIFNNPTTGYVQGFDANTMWSFEYLGLTNFGTDQSPLLRPSVLGENGLPVPITTFPVGNAINFMRPQGTRVAPTIMGMRNALKVFDFDLSFIVTAKFGHVYRRHGFNYYDFSANSGQTTFINNKYSEVVNGDPNQIVPIPEFEPEYSGYSFITGNMDYLTADASHIRLQEINVTYSLPGRLTEKLGIDALNIFVQGNNLGTILFNDFGEDPEYPIGNLRLQRSFTYGLNFNF